MNEIRGVFADISKIPPAHYIFSEAGANEFLLLRVEGHEALGMLWNNSTTGAPEIRKFHDLHISIVSISNIVVLLSEADGTVVLKMPLHEELVDVEVCSCGIWLIMETMLLKIDRANFTVDAVVPLPDVIDAVKIGKSKIEIRGVTGQLFVTDYC